MVMTDEQVKVFYEFSDLFETEMKSKQRNEKIMSKYPDFEYFGERNHFGANQSDKKVCFILRKIKDAAKISA